MIWKRIRNACKFIGSKKNAVRLSNVDWQGRNTTYRPGILAVGHPSKYLEKVSALSVALISTSFKDLRLCSKSFKMINRKSWTEWL